jgi:hypothetical protein
MERREVSLLGEGERWLQQYQGPLALAATTVGRAVEVVLHPVFVVPLLLLPLARPAATLGWLSTLLLVAWLLPRLLAGPALWAWLPEHWLSWALATRALLLALLAGGFLILAGAPGALVTLLTLLGVGFWAIGGLLAAGQPEGAAGDHDGEFTMGGGLGQLARGAAATVAGLLLARLLAPDGPPFPGWAGQWLLLAALALGGSAALAWRARPAGLPPEGAGWTYLALAPALLLHGVRLRRYLVFRLLLVLAAAVDPFLLLYALRAFDLPLQGIGLYLALFALVRLVTGLAYPTMVAAGYARLLGQSAVLCRVLVPLLALTLPLILQSGPVTSRLPEQGWLGAAAFASIIILYALATAGIEATDAAYLRDALAPAHRPAVRALVVLALIVLSPAFIIAGSVADRWGFELLLAVAAGISLVAALASGLLLEVPPDDTRTLTETGALPTFRSSSDW